jgi:desulfoferrodoxin (superoxide reductase-like protein)
LIRQKRGEGRTEVGDDEVEQTTGEVKVVDEQHLSTHFAVSAAEKTVRVALHVVRNTQPILKTNIVIESVTVDVGEAEHAMEADPHPQKDWSDLVEKQSKVDKVRLVPRMTMYKEQSDTIDDNAERDELHKPSFTVQFVVFDDQATILKVTVQKSHLLKQSDQSQSLHGANKLNRQQCRQSTDV